MNLLTGNLLVLCMFIATALTGPVQENTAQNVVLQSVNKFGNAFVQNLSTKKNVNLATSPLGAAVVLSMMAQGAGGKTQQQLKDLLHLPTDDNLIKSGMKNLIDKIKNSKVGELQFVNNVFTSNKLSVKPEFKELIKTYFQSATQSVNFDNSVEATKNINSYVKDQTKSHIKELDNAKNTDSQTKMVLVNTLYFKGLWKTEFYDDVIRTLSFHTDENTNDPVVMMYRHHTYNYGKLDDLRSTFVEIPYKDDELSMLVILPNKTENLADVEAKLRTKSLADIRSKGSPSSLNLYFPRFKIECEFNLENDLKNMGLTEMFTKDADFSGIADEKLQVNNFIQKVVIEVDENGLKNDIGEVPSPEPPVTAVVVDRPFYYMIFDPSSDAVLLEGRMYRSTEK